MIKGSLKVVSLLTLGASWLPIVHSTVLAHTIDPNTTGVILKVVSSGNQTQAWKRNGNHGVTLDSLSYTDGANWVSVRGKTKGQRDLLVGIYQDSKHGWTYSVPIQKDGSFAASVLVPFKGKFYLEVDSVLPGKPWYWTKGFPWIHLNNNHESLNQLQISLLQNGFVNYNESSYICTTALDITKNAKTPLEKMKAVHDWVAWHMQYDWNESSWWVAKQATDALRNHLGDCVDESDITAAMLRSIGIPTQVVPGKASYAGTPLGHAWNRAWDGQKWIYFDVTWDQVYVPAYKRNDKNVYPVEVLDNWFNPKDSKLFPTTHFPSPNILWQ